METRKDISSIGLYTPWNGLFASDKVFARKFFPVFFDNIFRCGIINSNRFTRLLYCCVFIEYKVNQINFLFYRHKVILSVSKVDKNLGQLALMLVTTRGYVFLVVVEELGSHSLHTFRFW